MSSSPNVTRRSRGSESPQRDESAQRRIEAARKAAAAGSKKRGSKESILEKYKYQIVFGVFGLVCVFALLQFLSGDRRKLNTVPVIEEEEIEAFNNQNLEFSLAKNEFFEGWKLSDVKPIVRNSLSNKPTLPRCMTEADTAILPDKYNFRTAKPECAGPVYNQGNCSASYAIAAASVISDRLCAQSQGKITTRLSPQHVLACDKAKGEGNQGCLGGAVNQVFEFAKKEGLVDEKCLPYNPDSESTKCPESQISQCSREKVLDYCVTNGEEGLKREIYKNGPIVSIIPIYKDFLTYSKGTYHVIEGTPRFQGGHIVKVIGWDKDANGDGYWIVENSWGETWGINGFAHVAHGQKQLLIEEFSLAVTPFIEGQEAPETAGEAPANEAGREDEDVKPEVVDLDSA